MGKVNALNVIKVGFPLIGGLIFVLLFFIFMQVISFYDTRYADKDRLHGDFSVVRFLKDGRFYRVALSELNELNSEPDFLTSNSLSDEIKKLYPEVFSYEMVKETEGGFLVNTYWKNDDRTVWSSYRVMNNKVIPIKSRLYAFDYMPMAVVLAFVSTLFITLLLKRLLR